jgi:filamentous hemagglutinin
VDAQVIADRTAPGNQQPTVLSTASGVTQVNIMTPSAAGVSRNTYSQFDVTAKGVILNNSRTDTNTQIGGYVQGNPWLATGGARVILNEVNSSSASQLKGYVEVAGQRAEVIIANPAGIAVNGGGFLNASAVTLGAISPGALSHFLTVLRDRPVALAIALVESLSRSFKRLTLPITSMVITFWYLLN